jgi:hypothetical protein
LHLASALQLSDGGKHPRRTARQQRLSSGGEKDFTTTENQPAHSGGVRGGRTSPVERNIIMLGTVLLVLLILMLIGAFPTWPHSKSWGYFPSGGLGLLVVILLILVLTGRF